MPTLPIASWNGALPNDLLLDSGVLYIGANVFAAQDGALKYDRGISMRQTAFDGQRSPIVGLDRTTELKPKLTGTIIQFPSATLQSLSPGMVAVTFTGGPTGATQLQPKTPGVLYAAGDYLANVRAVWQRGDGTFFQIRFPKSLCVKWDVAGVEKAEAKINFEIDARLDMAAAGVSIYTPPMIYEYFTAATP
jgi:hypothetical protein